MPAADLQQVEVDLYGLKGKVNSFYFAILVFRRIRGTWRSTWKPGKVREVTMQTAIANGTMLEAEMKVIEVEILKVKQSMVEMDSRRTPTWSLEDTVRR